MANLLPPIIDNTVGAFELKPNSSGVINMPIKFYYQASTKEELDNIEDQYNIRQVIVQVTYNGKSVLKYPYIICSVDKTAEAISLFINDLDMSYYNCQVPSNYFNSSMLSINKGYEISIRAIKKGVQIINLSEDNYQNNLFNWVDDNNKEHFGTLMSFINGDESNNIPNVSQWSAIEVKYGIPPVQFKLYGGLSALNNNGDLLYDSTDALAPRTFKYNFEAYKIKGELSFDKIEFDLSGGGQQENDILLWYSVQLIDIFKDNKTGNFVSQVIASSSDKEYIDYDYDRTRRSFIYEFKEDLNSWYLDKISPEQNNIKTLQLVTLFVTKKGYKGGFVSDLIVDEQTIESSSDVTMDFIGSIIGNEKEGYVEINKIALDKHIDASIDGILYLDRGVKKDNDTSINYQEIQYKAVSLNRRRTVTSMIDRSAESGIPYVYRIRFSFYNTEEKLVWAKDKQENQKVVKELNSQPYILMIEDSFLLTKELTLKLRFDTTINNLKYNYQEIATPTLGGAYPFTRRNGDSFYKTFSVGGLISYQGDKGATANSDLISKKNTQSKYYVDESYFGNLDFYNQERIKEKLFREQVLEFLCADQIFLFKSFQEGNIFVRLSNIQLTPKKELGRNIYSFSATATEVQEASAANYLLFFSEIKTNIAYIIANLYIQVASEEVFNDESQTTIFIHNTETSSFDESNIKTATIVQQTTYFAINPHPGSDLSNEKDWTSTISDRTYYTPSGSPVRPIKINNSYTFSPNKMPKFRIKEEETGTTLIDSSQQNYSIDLHFDSYKF